MERKLYIALSSMTFMAHDATMSSETAHLKAANHAAHLESNGDAPWVRERQPQAQQPQTGTGDTSADQQAQQAQQAQQ